MNTLSLVRRFSMFVRLMVVVSLLLGMVALPAAPAQAQAGTIYYVSPLGSDSNTGTSWEDAFLTLQQALATATAGAEIWVEDGTYFPDEGPSQTDNDRTATFSLKDGVAIYGGFAGDEEDRSERDVITNVTILSGDLDESGTATNNDAYHVVTSDGNADTAQLDGFTITGGNANGSDPNDRGGGIYTFNSSQAQFANLTISRNTASGSGGGVYNFNSSPSFTNVTISGNQSNNGGGVFNDSSSPSFTNVMISGNTASSVGGGVYTFNSSQAQFANLTISGNTAAEGGGVVNDNSSPSFTNVTISSNTATNDGGGMANFSSNASFTNVTISGNTATNDGGGMANFSSNASFTNVTISGNTATNNGGGVSNSVGSPSFTNVTISGNTATNNGGGVSNLNSSPSFTNSIIWGNSTQVDNSSSTPTYTYSLVQGLNPSGTGNLDGTAPANDPLFINPIAASSAPTTAGNYRLQTGSPARDVGNNAANTTSTDLDGNARVFNGTIDLGAYEFPALTGTIYVDKDRPDDSGDGLSWATAKRNLQSALAIAGSGAEIWVAAGTYYPDEGTGQTDNSRTSTFSLKDGVAIYGGFAGGETLLSERNVTVNVATLSGDLDQSGTATNNDAYHVVTSDGNADTAQLDGFTITGGNANGSFPKSIGGGVFVFNNSQAQFANTTINDNAAVIGGGVYNDNSSPSFTNVTISGNTASNGGGAYNLFAGTSPSFTNVTISGNTATNNGGGVSNSVGSPSFTNVTISGNTATDGGGVYNDNSTASFTNSIIWGNSTQVLNENSATPTYQYSLVDGESAATLNASSSSSGSNFNSTNPLFINPIAASSAPTTAGNYRLQTGSPARDVGNNAANSTSTDPDGNARVFNGTIDLGAYEFPDLTGVVYVDINTGNDSNDGLSWNTAKQHLQSALAIVGSGAQIWVADGTYYSDEGAGQFNDARTSTFKLKDGVAIYGGFAGNETLLSQRDPATNVATLSGEIQQDANPSNNAYHVVSSDSNATTARLDGFTITGGNANGLNAQQRNRGSGVYTFNNSQAQFANLTISSSTATFGGGVYNFNSSPSFTNVTISGNTATTDGGGVYNDNSTASFTNVTISGNTASDDGGGGVFNNSGSPSFTSVIISGNTTNGLFGGGGGVYNFYSSPSFTNVTISGNTSTAPSAAGCSTLTAAPASPTSRSAAIKPTTTAAG